MTDEIGEVNPLTCDDCGEEKDDVEATFCPFAREINDEDIPMNLCSDCYQERADDI